MGKLVRWAKTPYRGRRGCFPALSPGKALTPWIVMTISICFACVYSMLVAVTCTLLSALPGSEGAVSWGVLVIPIALIPVGQILLRNTFRKRLAKMDLV